MTTPPDDRWRSLSDEVFHEVRAWRTHHPHATLREIEIELDTRLARLRARMLQDTALASPATDWAAQPPAAQPVCPDCQQPLTRRGSHTRHLQTHHDQVVALPRQYGTCSACGRGLFPPR